MKASLRLAVVGLTLALGLSGCSMCDGWFWQKNKACGDGSAFVQ